MLGGIGLGGQSLDSLAVADYLAALGNMSSRPELPSSNSPDAQDDGMEGGDDSQPTMFSRAASPSQPAAWDAPVPTSFDDVIDKLQDKNIDLKRVVETITKSVGKVSEQVCRTRQSASPLSTPCRPCTGKSPAPV